MPAVQSTRQQLDHAQRLESVVIAYLKEHGPMPRRIALADVAEIYQVTLKSKSGRSLETLRTDFSLIMRGMVASGKLLRGRAPHQRLSLPTP